MKYDQLHQDLATIGRNAIDKLIAADRERENRAETERQVRALRLADHFAEDLVRSEGVRCANPESYLFDPDEIASSDMLSDCIDHLCWRDLATRIDKSDEVEVILHDD